MTTLHVLTRLLVHVAAVLDEAYQSHLLICLVALVPADPDVAVLGEELLLARLLHHFFLMGSTMSEGTI